MNDEDFRKWPRTKRFLDSEMIITQKMNGTNAQILFNDIGTYVGSRNKWLSPQEDNFRFFAWVSEHRDTLFLDVLGRGRHYGEWCGPGIQNGEGLEERKFFSFNPFLNVPEEYSHLIETVPVLYMGPLNMSAIYDALLLLKEGGSQVDGPMTKNNRPEPEGIIININGGQRLKIYLKDLKEFNLRYVGV